MLNMQWLVEITAKVTIEGCKYDEANKDSIVVILLYSTASMGNMEN